MTRIHRSGSRGVHAVIALFGGVALLGACASFAAQTTFATPEQAASALYRAAKADDTAALRALYGDGPEVDDLVSSGDPIADHNERQAFVRSYHARHRLVADGEGRRELEIGRRGWHLPIPIVRTDGAWRFDGRAGARELIYRRIGRNELGAIATCEGIVVAQAEYRAMNPEHSAEPHYAGRLLSEPGRRNGLYWPVEPGEPRSPAGELVARASAQGYTEGSDAPYHGYYFRLLDGQTAAAEGGAHGYVVDGEYRNGYAVVAWPADYRASGVMTFIVNQNGVVFQKDLGEDTTARVQAMTAFDPGEGWTIAGAP